MKGDLQAVAVAFVILTFVVVVAVVLAGAIR